MIAGAGRGILRGAKRHGGDWMGLLGGRAEGRFLTEGIGKAVPSLTSNQPINQIRGFYAGGTAGRAFEAHGAQGQRFLTGGFLGGIPRTFANMRQGMGAMDALNVAHRGAEGGLAWGSIAGSYLTAATAGRIATGGGLYKDRHGRTNIVGVPFI